jgi:hypothetical protein
MLQSYALPLVMGEMDAPRRASMGECDRRKYISFAPLPHSSASAAQCMHMHIASALRLAGALKGAGASPRPFRMLAPLPCPPVAIPNRLASSRGPPPLVTIAKASPSCCSRPSIIAVIRSDMP